MKRFKRKHKIPTWLLLLCLLAGLVLSGFIGYMTGKGLITFTWQ